MIRITLVGATGWVGRELVRAISASSDLQLVAAVARNSAGRDVGEAAGLGKPLGVIIAASVEAALATASDVVIDYTKPHVVKAHVLAAVAAKRHVVIGTSGLTADDYAEIDAAATAAAVGVIAAGNFSITATLMKRAALDAARYVRDVEIIDFGGAAKPDVPSGTARELAEALGAVRMAASSKPINELGGARETRGATIGATQVHSVRMPGYALSCEVVFGADGERLSIRHDAGASAQPYVSGTLLAAREVRELKGLLRGMDALLDRVK